MFEIEHPFFYWESAKTIFSGVVSTLKCHFDLWEKSA